MGVGGAHIPSCRAMETPGGGGIWGCRRSVNLGSDADFCLSWNGPADKDESEHPNNSFNPCSAHDHRCLQKHMAKMRDRSKMKVVGTPREEPRPVVSASDPHMCMLIDIPQLLDLGHVHPANTEAP